MNSITPTALCQLPDNADISRAQRKSKVCDSTLKDIFGKDIGRELIGRLAERGLIGTGPREPRRGAPHTFVTTERFLAAFGMESLHDLPEGEGRD